MILSGRNMRCGWWWWVFEQSGDQHKCPLGFNLWEIWIYAWWAIWYIPKNISVHMDMNVCMVACGQFSIHSRISWMYTIPLVPHSGKRQLYLFWKWNLFYNFSLSSLSILFQGSNLVECERKTGQTADFPDWWSSHWEYTYTSESILTHLRVYLNTSEGIVIYLTEYLHVWENICI